MCGGCGRRGSVRGFSAANRPPRTVGLQNQQAQPTVGQLRALGLNTAAVERNKQLSPSTNEERRRIEKLRRDAIRRRFNK
jgi:hypothetical protein